MILPGDEDQGVNGKVPALSPASPIELHLDIDRSQLLLFGDGAELLTIEEDERSGKYSGKIIDKNKAKVQAIVQALASGVGQLKVASAFSVSVHTVRAIIQRHPELIAIEEKKLSSDIGFAVKLGVERYIEAIVSGAIPAAQLPVGLGILFDKKQLLDGKPTAIQGSSKPVLTLESMKQALEALPEAIDVESEKIGGKSETQSGGQSE